MAYVQQRAMCFVDDNHPMTGEKSRKGKGQQQVT